MPSSSGQRICDRAVTAIAYLNPGWREEDGGCLRIHKLGGSGYVDVAPEFGRLVLFKVTTHSFVDVMPNILAS